jgi:hypothetical protein
MASPESPLYTRGELKTRISQTDVLFGSAYRISSLKDATLRILLWLLLSFPHPLICIFRGSVEVQMPSRTQITKRPLEDKANRLAAFYVSKTVRCLPYLGQVDMSPSGLHYGLLVAIQASRVYSHSRDRARFLWAQDLFSTLQLAGFDYVQRFRKGPYWANTHKQNLFRLLSYRETIKKSKGSIRDHSGSGN